MVKGDSFAMLSSEDKLDRMYNEIRCGNGLSAKNHKELSGKLDKLVERVVTVENKVENIDSKCNFLESKVKQLTVKVIDLEQKNLECNIVVRNVPEIEKNEQDLCAIVNLLIQRLKLDFEPNICCIRRMGKKGHSPTVHRPILLQVTDKVDKTKLLIAKKKTKITCDQLAYEDKNVGTVDNVVYFDEHLTKELSQLYFLARNLRKRQLVKYVFIRNGTLLIKRSDNSPVVKIVDQEELKSFEKRKLNSTELDEPMHEEQVINVSSIIEHNTKKLCTQSNENEPGKIETRSSKKDKIRMNK